MRPGVSFSPRTRVLKFATDEADLDDRRDHWHAILDAAALYNSDEDSADDTSSEEEEEQAQAPAAEPAVLMPTPEAPSASPLPPPETFDQNRWERFVEAIRSDAPAFAGNLDHGQVLSYQDGALRLGFSSGGYSVTDARQHLPRLLSLLREHVGELSSVTCDETDHVESSPFQRRQVRHAEEVEARQQELLAHPSLTAVVERFDGQVRGVEVEHEGLSGGKIDHE